MTLGNVLIAVAAALVLLLGILIFKTAKGNGVMFYVLSMVGVVAAFALILLFVLPRVGFTLGISEGVYNMAFLGLTVIAATCLTGLALTKLANRPLTEDERKQLLWPISSKTSHRD